RFTGPPAVPAALDGAARYAVLEPARSAEPPPGPEDGAALGTAGGPADGCDAAHLRSAVAEPPHPCRNPHRQRRREGLGRVRRGKPEPPADLRRSGMGR